MHVQFIGLPASGKSTLVKCMVETWPESYIKANPEFDSLRLMSRKRPLIFAKSLIAILPVLSLILIGASRPGLHWKDKYKSVAGLLVNIGNYFIVMKQQKITKKITLWDEFVLQRALSIFGYSTERPNDKFLNTYLSWAQCQFDLQSIYVQSCPVDYYDHLLKRGLPERMKSLDNATLLSIIENHMRVINSITLKLDSIYLVDTNMPLKDSCDQLDKRLRDLSNDEQLL